MARPLRIEYPGALYHVTSRGNARADIVDDDSDRGDFVDTLSATVDRFGWLWLSCMAPFDFAARGEGADQPRVDDNGDPHPLTDVRVRQALIYALDTQVVWEPVQERVEADAGRGPHRKDFLGQAISKMHDSQVSRRCKTPAPGTIDRGPGKRKAPLGRAIA